MSDEEKKTEEAPENQEEQKDEAKDEAKEEPKEEPKGEPKEEAKEEAKEDTKDEPKPDDGGVGEKGKDSDEVVKGKKGAFPKRYIVAIMVFLGICVQYALRVNLSVAIGAMCNPHTVEENGFTVRKVNSPLPVSSLFLIFFYTDPKTEVEKADIRHTKLPCRG